MSTASLVTNSADVSTPLGDATIMMTPGERRHAAEVGLLLPHLHNADPSWSPGEAAARSQIPSYAATGIISRARDAASCGGMEGMHRSLAAPPWLPTSPLPSSVSSIAICADDVHGVLAPLREYIAQGVLVTRLGQRLVHPAAVVQYVAAVAAVLSEHTRGSIARQPAEIVSALRHWKPMWSAGVHASPTSSPHLPVAASPGPSPRAGGLGAMAAFRASALHSLSLTTVGTVAAAAPDIAVPVVGASA